MANSRRPLRTTRAALAGLLAAGLVVAGCGSPEDGEQPDAETTEASSSDDFPVTIEHTYGETTVENEPERIVTVGLTEQDALLALGVVPVGTTEWFGEHPGAIWPWATEALEAAGGETPEVVGPSAEINFEGIAAQNPDLILAVYSGLTETEYQRLSDIAPTVAQPADYIDYGIPWQELTRTVGQAVGKAEEAEAIVNDVEAQFEAVREEHPEFVGATSVVATPYEGIYLYGSEDARGRLLTNLGFDLPDGLADVTGDEFGGGLSEENVDLIDVDAIVWLDAADVGDDLGGPLYSDLAVHTEGREVFLDSFNDPLGAATSFVTPLSLPYLLDGLVPQLAAAVDGDPTTEVR